jgi:phosphatidylinositol alpha-mannosyltransferase
MALRAVSWYASLQASLPRAGIRLTDAMRALFVGVLVSSTLPANLGEPSRALIVVRRTERPWENLPVVAGTLMSQILVNVATLAVLGAVTLASVNLFGGYQEALIAGLIVALVAMVVVLLTPTLLSRATIGPRMMRVHTVATRLRSGLIVFRQPRLASITLSGQVLAWVLQWLAVYVLLAGLHLTHQTGVLAAVAILFAVNVTMLLPVTPGDIGVFQAAVAAVLHAGWHVAYGRGVAFGVVLQAAELVTAILMGLPALLKEGLSWRYIASHPLGAADLTVPAADGSPSSPAAPSALGPSSGPSDPLLPNR